MYWTVAVAAPHKTDDAIADLDDEGFETYAPRYRYRKRHRGKRRWFVAYIFQRYLFVRAPEEWVGILGLRSISRLLLDNGVPAKVPDKWVTNMRAREVDGFIDIEKSRFKLGQRVDIKAGKFAGHSGFWNGVAHERDIVMLEALGRVELGVGDI